MPRRAFTAGLRVATMYSFASAIALMAYEYSLGNIPLAQALRPIGVARTAASVRGTPRDASALVTRVGMARSVLGRGSSSVSAVLGVRPPDVQRRRSGGTGQEAQLNRYCTMYARSCTANNK